MKTGRILKEGEGGPLFLLGVSEGEEAYVSSVFGLVREMSPGKAFTLAAFETDDWNRYFSPWPAEGFMSGETFQGGGAAALEWLSEALKAGFSLSDSSESDLIIGYCIDDGVYGIDDINELLFEFDQPLLGSK